MVVNEAIHAIYKKMSKVARKARRRYNAYRETCYHAYSQYHWIVKMILNLTRAMLPKLRERLVRYCEYGCQLFWIEKGSYR